MPLTRSEENLKRDLKFDNDFESTLTGDLGQIDGRDNLRQAIFHRMITRPGSIPHRPDYGIGILDFQNAAGSLQTQQDIMLRMQDQFLQDERIEALEALKFEQSETNPSQFTITLTVRPAGLERQEIELGPFGGST